MGERGPKSQAEKLAPVPTALPTRPGPPDHLDELGRERWVELVNELPVDRVRVSDLRLLSDLIQSERYVSECDDTLRKYGQVIGPGAVPNPALAIRAGHVRVIIALQRALRLCPSMRMRHDAAGLGKTKPKGKKKLWDT